MVDHHSARRILEESIALGRESGDPVPVVYSMLILGHIVASEGNIVRAREITEDALEIARRNDARDFINGLLVLLGDIAARDGDWEAADNQYRQALQFSIGGGSRVRLAHAILKFAWLRSAQGEHQQAVGFLGALSRVDYRMARGLAREVGALVVDEQAVIAAARAALSDRAFAAAWAAGEALMLEQVSAEILAPTSVH